MHKLRLLALVLLLLASMQSPVFSEDLTDGHTLLVITASQSHASGNVNEFIVLRTSRGGVSWSASAVLPRDGGKEAGSLPTKSVSLTDVFRKVNDANQDDSPSVLANRFCSLLIVDDTGSRSCVSLDAKQLSNLQALLRPVLDDILKNGPYAKRHVMLDFLLSSDAARATIKPASNE